MAYTRDTSVDASQGGDTIKQAILDTDTDLTNIFTHLNTHEALTEGAHGIAAGQDIVGTTETQTLTNKTLTAPTINAGTATLLTALSIANNVDVGNYKITALQLESDVPTGTAPFVIASTTVVTNLNADKLDGKDGPTGSIVGTSDSQALTNKTLTSPVLNTGLSGTAFLDEDNMASDSATKAASQQSIKAYIDAYDVELQSLTTVEIQQLQNIGIVTISAAQWGWLGASDQPVSTGATPTFAGMTINGAVQGTGVKDEDDMASDSATAVASQQSIKAYVDAEIGESSTMIPVATLSPSAVSSFQFTGLEGGVIYLVRVAVTHSTKGGYTFMRLNEEASNEYSWMLDQTYNYNGGGGPFRAYSYDAADDQVDLNTVNKDEFNAFIEVYQRTDNDFVMWFGNSGTFEVDTDYYTYQHNFGGQAPALGTELVSLEIHTSTGTMTGTATLFKIVPGV